MPEGSKKSASAGKGGGAKVDRRRLNYLKLRSQEIKKELQANKAETDALRKKLGMAPKTKKKSAGG